MPLALPVCFVNFYHIRHENAIFLHPLQTARQLCFKLMQHGCTFHAQHAFLRTDHPYIGHISRSLPAKFVSSFVCTWVCVPTTAKLGHPNTNPSRFSRRSLPHGNQREYILFSYPVFQQFHPALRNGQSIGGKNVLPCRLIIASSLPLALMIVMPCPGASWRNWPVEPSEVHHQSIQKYLCYPKYDCPS